MLKKVKDLFLIFVFSSAFSFPLFYGLCKFNILPDSTTLFGPLGVSIIILAFLIYKKKTKKKALTSTKTRKWLEHNIPQIILIYLLTAICIASIETELIWNEKEIKEIISLEWTMLSISITIFLVWDVIIIQFLKQQQPHRKNHFSVLNEIEYIEEKDSFHQLVAFTFNSVYFIIINIVVLILATSTTYLSKSNVSIADQTLVHISFYVCTNTMILLFMDILQPIKQQKEQMLEASKVTAEDLELQKKTLRIIRDVKEICDYVDEEIDTIPEEQKQKIINIFLQFISLFNRQKNSDDVKSE